MEKIKNTFSLTSVSLAIIIVFGFFTGFVLFTSFNLPLYILVAVFGLLVGIVNPQAAIAATIVLTLIFAKKFSLMGITINADVYKFYLPDILLIAAYIGLAARFLKGEVKMRWQPEDFLLILFIFITSFYFFYSFFFLDGGFALVFSSFKNYAFYALLYFAVYLNFRNGQQIKALASLAFGGVLAIIYFIGYGLFTGTGLWTEITPLTTSGSRLLDFDHAFYLSLASFASLAYIVFGKNKKLQTILKFILPIFVFGIIGSLMRHLWLAGIAVLAFFCLLPVVRQSQKISRTALDYIMAGSFAVLLIAVVINILPLTSLNQKIVNINNQTITRVISLANSNDTSFAWRESVWASAWGEYKQKLVTGIGFGQKVFVQMPDYLDYVEVRNIHNSYLAILIQMGMLPLLLLVSLFFVVFIKLIINIKSWPLASSSLACMILFSGLVFAFQPYLEANFFNIIFWSVLGLSRRVYEGVNG